MKKRVVILAVVCFLIKNSSAMLEGTTTPAPDPEQNQKNSTTNLLGLAHKKRQSSLQSDKANRCCAFLDCIFGHLGNLQPQTSFGIPQHERYNAQEE